MVNSQLRYSPLALNSGFISLIYRASKVGNKFKLRYVDASILTSFNVGVHLSKLARTGSLSLYQCSLNQVIRCRIVVRPT